MRIARRDFLKMLGVFGGALVAEGLAPQGIVKSGEIMLPDKPTVVGPMPRMGGGLSEFIEIDVQNVTIALENPFVTEWSMEDLSLGPNPRYIAVNLSILADRATTRLVDNWIGTMHGRNATLRIPRRRGEWLCLYCGSAQPMFRTHCFQCGGARDWVIT
jgi:hypothetical protein